MSRGAPRLLWVLTALLAVAGIVLTATTAPGAVPAPTAVEHRLRDLEGRGDRPAAVRFGVQLDWSADSPARYEERSGVRPAVYGEFLEFPFRPEVAGWLEDKIHAVKEAHGVFMLTLEPGIAHGDGLRAVTPQALDELAAVLRTWNAEGVPVLVRYGHEMNGAWYPWSQDPAGYVQSFRSVADVVHTNPLNRMLWSPNEGGGYPFVGGQYQARPGTPAYALLDTDHDGTVTQDDDPYQPYWPGGEYADWVGLTLYHFGRSYPWRDNVVPEPGKFVQKITGTFDGGNGDERAVPDFYARYAEAEGKPMAISETSALFNENAGAVAAGASEVEIKDAWLDQVFAADIPTRFPRLRLLAWFEQTKVEQDVQGAPESAVSWSLTRDEATEQAFRRRIPAWLEMAPA